MSEERAYPICTIYDLEGFKGINDIEEKLRKIVNGEYLIYAAYGSNLLKERFLRYIKGGEYRGYQYSGSRDKTEPRHMGWIWVPYRLYFAKSSSRWCGGGVAFLATEKETDPQYFSVARLWKISLQQFVDLILQEGEWYSIVLRIGHICGLDIFTITGNHLKDRRDPSLDYLDVIIRGLMETTGWNIMVIIDYLNKRIGKPIPHLNPCI